MLLNPQVSAFSTSMLLSQTATHTKRRAVYEPSSKSSLGRVSDWLEVICAGAETFHYTPNIHSFVKKQNILQKKKIMT